MILDAVLLLLALPARGLPVKPAVVAPVPAAAPAVAAAAAPQAALALGPALVPAAAAWRAPAAAEAPGAAPELGVRMAEAAREDSLSGGVEGRAAALSETFDLTARFPGATPASGTEGAPEPSRLLAQLEGPARALRERGVERRITMYGSARIPSPEEAGAGLAAARKAAKAAPGDAAARAAVKKARERLRLSRHYDVARRFAGLVVKRWGGKVAVATGGGPGIMRAGNQGAFEAGGLSVGFNITLPFEQQANPFLTPGLDIAFDDFFVRKMFLGDSLALSYHAGGWGTMDELFEMLRLIGAAKRRRVPLLLFGRRAYWDKIFRFHRFVDAGLVSREEWASVRFVETPEEGVAAIEAFYRDRGLDVAESPGLAGRVGEPGRRARVPGSAALLDDLEGARRALVERGVEHLIVSHGSSRIRPPGEARRNLRRASSRARERPAARVAEARAAVNLSRHYEVARRFGELAARRWGGKVALATGGGEGIAEAVNRGAFEAGGKSVALNVRTPEPQRINPYITPGLRLDVDSFAAQKALLRNAVALSFHPGGWGTLDPMFEIMTLIQTGKHRRIPILFFGGRSYWSQFIQFERFASLGLISPRDMDIVRFVETPEEAIEAIEAFYHGDPSAAPPAR
ncbi:MAG: LOG family protein [Elusimicrobia bacterium]|nr:LOG family protein [Elusimicrobiota bacterium]